MSTLIKRRLALALALTLCIGGTMQTVVAVQPGDAASAAAVVEEQLEATAREDTLALAEASSGTIGDNLTWTLTEDGTLTISGNGAMDFENEHPFYENEAIRRVVIEEGVTSIGDDAFWRCTGLTSVTIPATVTEIGGRSFAGCTGLISVVIPEGVTKIGSSAFSGCTGLTSLTIPASVKTIEYDAFHNCTGLTSVTLSEGLSEIEGFAFSDCTALTSVTIPASVTSIGWRAFYGCSSLTSVTIPASVTRIESDAFYGCAELTVISVDAANEVYCSVDNILYNKAQTELILCPAKKTGTVTLPDSVSSIAGGAFSMCTGLQAIEVGAANENYADVDGVLYNKELTELIVCPPGKSGSVTIPDSITDIPYGAFSGCTNLTDVIIPDGVISIGEEAFSNCTNLTSITIPSSVTSIESHAFYRCSSLTSVIIPDSVTNIGWRAFSDCTELTNVTIPEGITVLRKDTFAYSGLTSVTIPASVTAIGQGVFEGCANLEEILVAEGNPSYFSEDGVLFKNTDSGTELAIYPGGKTGKTYTVGSNVTTISYGALASCAKLKNVVIPETVTSIENWAFARNQDLKIAFTGAGAYEWGDNISLFIFGIDEATESVATVYHPETDGWNALIGGWQERAEKYPDSHIGDVTWTAWDYSQGLPFDLTEDPEPTPDPDPDPAPDPETPNFTDVPEDQWYYNAVNWGVEHNVTSGFEDNTFRPDNNCTRAQIVQFLYNQAGKPAYETTENPFTDVEEGAWYYDAVLWAVEKGITSGMGDGIFGVNNPCTREQAVTFLWNAQGKVSATSNEGGFTDVPEGQWYYNSVMWAVENKVTAGIGGGLFGVGNPCTRAAIVQFLYNLETK